MYPNTKVSGSNPLSVNSFTLEF